MAVGFCALAGLDYACELRSGRLACIVLTDKTDVFGESCCDWLELYLESRYCRTRRSEWVCSKGWICSKVIGARIALLENAGRDRTWGSGTEEVASGCTLYGFPASVELG